MFVNPNTGYSSNVAVECNIGEEQQNIVEQLNEKITTLDNLIKSKMTQNDIMKIELQQLIQKYNELEQQQGDHALESNQINEDISNITGRIENLNITLDTLEKIKLTLQKLQNTGVFSVLVKFVQKYSDNLLKGEIVDFTPVFTQIRDIVNNSIRNIYYSPEEILLENLRIQTGNDTDSLNIYNVQCLLMSEALSMCPGLNVRYVLRINDEERLIEGIQIDGNDDIYGYQISNNYHLGIDKGYTQ